MADHVTIGELIPQGEGKNARKHTPRNIGMIAASLQEVGAARSIVIDENNEILAGNGTWEAAGQVGIERVRVVEADGNELIAVRRIGLTDAQKKRLAVADNRTAELAEWDVDVLAELREQEGILDGLFRDDELDALLASIAPEPGGGGDEFDTTPSDGPTRVQRGDLWRLGEHRLMCGDSTKAEDVARLMGDERADMVLTDPPYGMGLDTDWSDVSGSLRSIGAKNHTTGNKYERVTGDDEPFDPSFMLAEFAYCKEIFLWGADYYAERIINRGEGSWLVWDKRKESQSDAIGAEFELCWSRAKHKRRMLRHDWFGFLSSANAREARNRMHPTQKPTTLIMDIMQQWGEVGDIVTDLYLGSGTTLIAAQRLNRRCYGMEIEPRYCDVIIRRAEAEGISPIELVSNDGTQE